MKKLINKPADLVTEALRGLGAAHKDLLIVSLEPKYVKRRDAPVARKVGLVSGGGSGHEPLHCGFIGRGMLDAACPGEVFTSPTPDQIEAATSAVDGGAGVLHIVKNYSGDVMNFDMAAELSRGAGHAVSAVVVADDVASATPKERNLRRGTGTTLFVEKICGAAAERGADLAALVELGRKCADVGRSVGVALAPCTVPAVGHPTFTLADNEFEFGIGIHGEPGRSRLPITSASAIAQMMCRELVGDLPFRRGDSALALVNGMGGTPLLELYLLYQEAERCLAADGITIAACLVGSYVTSLEMQGASMTLLRSDAALLDLWNAPVLTPALRWGV
jgi:dihydroxyacetone kinase-like protein